MSQADSIDDVDTIGDNVRYFRNYRLVLDCAKLYMVLTLERDYVLTVGHS